MKTYNTYQEAKIDNPNLDIKTDNLGSFFVSVGHTICNPADYCMTVEQFLKSGHKFADGDIILRHDDRVITANEDIGWNDWDILDDGDDERYILRAEALDKPETTEWKNGDECLYMGGNFAFIGMLCVPTLKGTADCMVQHEDGAPIMANVSELSKPESQEEKENRERLEAAYDLYSSWVSNSYGEPLFCFKAFCDTPDLCTKWLAIVDKTNYRKGE